MENPEMDGAFVMDVVAAGIMKWWFAVLVSVMVTALGLQVLVVGLVWVG